MEVLEKPAEPMPEDMIIRRIPSKEMLDLIRMRMRRPDADAEPVSGRTDGQP
jgi:hypothetical protein